MSAFKNKIKQLKSTTIHNKNCKDVDEQATLYKGNLRQVCSATEIRLNPKSSRSNLIIHEPTVVLHKNQKDKKQILGNKKVKKVEPFVPIDIPKSPPSGSKSSRNINLSKYCSNKNTQSSTPQLNREIEIHIDKDDAENKECLKKLFKKIHKLSQDLAASERQRIRMELELDNLKGIDGLNKGQEKDLMRSEGDNYKLKAEVQVLKNQLRDKNKEITDIKNKTPNHIIKQVVVQKPVQVRVEVPRYVPGPQKIIQVPKYIESETTKEEIQKLRKTVDLLEAELSKERELNRKRSNDDEFNVPAIIQKPVYLEKPVYVDRPIYIDRPYEVSKEKIVEVPVEVPFEVPVYIEKPILDDQIIKKITEHEQEVQKLLRENEELKIENQHMKYLMNGLLANIQILKRHNFSKNHEIETLLHNIDDYDPVKARATIHKQVKMIRRDNNSKQKLSNCETFNPRRFGS